jgi:integrase/recombinase XerD
MENHLQVSGNPLGTQKPYLRALRDLMESVKSIPEAMTADQIKAHLSALKGTISSSALNMRVCGIKYYFRKVVRRPELAVDIPNPRVAKYVQEVLSEREIDEQFAACQTMREKALLYLLFDSGIRSREVCGLKLTDFDGLNKQFTVRNGKGNKLRTLPYSDDLKKILIAYCRSLPAYPLEYLFENHQNPGTAITIRGVQYIVKEVLKRSKSKREIHPHSYRHCFAIHYINNGGNLLRLKELMGHEHIETTLHYLKFCTIPLTDTMTPLAKLLERKRQGKLKP